MSLSRWSFAALLASTVLTPAGAPRVVVRPDPGFAVPDSVLERITYVTDLAVDPDGSVYVADGRLPGVLQLEPSGPLRRTIGRAGEGPGEFVTAPFLGLYRDSLWVVDPGENRVTLFPRRGHGAVTIPFGYRAPRVPGGGPRSEHGLPVAMQPDGSFLVVENVPANDEPSAGYGRTLLLHASRAMVILDTVVALATPHAQIVFVWRDGSTYLNQPFADDPLYTFANDGTRMVTVTRTAPAGPGEQSFQVTLFGGAGSRPVAREIRYRPLPLPQTVVDSVIALNAEYARSNPGTPVTADSLRRRLFRPDYYPPVERVRLCRDGSIWLKVRFADGPVEGADWLVLSPRGFELKRVTMPADFRLLEADRSLLWGTTGDADEAPVLVRLRVAGRA